MASCDGCEPKPRRLRRNRLLVQPRAHRLAHQTRRLHQDLASPLVRPQTRQAPLVQGLLRHTRLPPPRRHLRRHLPHRQGRRGRPQQALRLRASTDRFTMYFIADSEKDKEEWINSIGRAIVQHSRSVTESEVVDYDSKR
ncbi:hypothetical protein LOK49_Contig434G00002 [Camellia lanceoleosa]|nr:hypothetical protein LOK49_Contig434G00002 [Camellia lanceoleosa]